MVKGYMELCSCRKIYRNETQRAVDPAVTLERIERLLPTIGITRVADITGLDRVGIPVFSCIRPAAADRSEERRVGKECRSRWWADH